MNNIVFPTSENVGTNLEKANEKKVTTEIANNTGTQKTYCKNTITFENFP